MKQVLVEGYRLIIDGLEAKCQLKYVIFSQVEDLYKLKPFLPNSGVRFYKIPYKEIELWSNLETSPGLFGMLYVNIMYYYNLIFIEYTLDVLPT